MRRVSLWAFTIASVLFGVSALLMGLLEVWHLAHGQTEHFAGALAGQAALVAAVFTVAALSAARARRGIARSA